MSCKDFEMNIYIYPELSQKERSQLDTHLQTCSGCTILFEEVKHAQQMIGLLAEEKIIPPHVARLTSNIMVEIAQPLKRTVVDQVNEFLVAQKTKFVLSTLSSVLLLVFCIQSLDGTVKFKEPKSASFANSVILNAKLFRENFSHNKEKRVLFADCRSPFQSSQYYLNCAKSKLK